MKHILEIQNISKKFRIGHQQSYLSLRDTVSHFFEEAPASEDFWALQDVSFEVSPGDSLGIIGRNGAGKSTLLKILSKITPPTTGKIICRGRVASLLEVGTGFHPELTGRENIFLNGAILGMKRQEIIKQFDGIIDFAGTEKFLDTPLKHYSSGMQLRLAFSVAAYLEPEVLIIDEVLAVGDAEFQKKCLGKMGEVSKNGRTILFVSHNMAAIESLCKNAVLLKSGKIDAIGISRDICRQYLKDAGLGKTSTGVSADQHFPRTGTKAQIERLEFLSEGIHTEVFFMGEDLKINLHYWTPNPLENPLMGMVLYSAMGAPILFFNNKHYGVAFGKRPQTQGIITMYIQSLNLMPGFYSLDIYFADWVENLDVKKECFTFQILYKHFDGAGEPLDEGVNAVFYKDIHWQITSKDLPND